MLADSVPVTERINAAATSNDTVYLPSPMAAHGGKYRCVECGLVGNAAAAANGTNYSTFTFTGSDGSTALGTLDTSATAIAAGTRRVITPSGSASVFTAATLTNAGIKVAKTHSGSGVAVDVQVYAIFEKIREV